MATIQKNGIQKDYDKEYVIEDGGVFVFKPQRNYKRLKAGKYYPMDDTKTFFLTKARQGASGEIANSADKVRPLYSLRAEMDEVRVINEYADELESNQFITNDDFFPTYKYNDKLNEFQDSVFSFINNRNEFLKKKGILLAGEHGVGKTYIINHVADKIIKDFDGIVLKIDRKEHLNALVQFGLSPISKYLSKRLKVIVIEELAEMSNMLADKTIFLSLLDSEVLNENVLFILTTNHPEELPKNLIDRPSRIDDVIVLKNKDYDPRYIFEWYEFITGNKFPEEEKSAKWFRNASKELSPAYFKELFNQTIQYNISLEEAWKKIKKRRDLIGRNFKDASVGFNS